MKKRIAPIALSVCAIVLAAVFAVSCSSEFEPAWKASGGKATLSIRLGKPDSPSASPRLIVQNGGYLYIQTGHDEGTAVLYGPWKVSAGDTFTTTDIPAGTYSAMHIFYMAEPLPDSDPIIPIEDMTFGGELGSRLEAYEMTLDSVSLATITDVTIIEGTTNVLKATLLPATTRYVNASEPLPAAHRFTDSPDSRERLFIQLTNTSFGIDIYKRLASLNLTIHNDSGSFSASLFYVALYRADGSFVSGQQISPSTIPAGGDRDITLPYSGATPDSLFLYVEYQGSEMQITFMSREIQALQQTAYFVTADGEGFGRSAGDPCTLQYALSSIADDPSITASNRATVYLVSNITVSSPTGLSVARPTVLTSGVGGPYVLTIGSAIDGSLFTVDNGIEADRKESLEITGLTVASGGGGRMANAGLVRVNDGTCTLGSGAILSGNVSTEPMGGGVAVMGATAVLTMNGATIQNCVAPNGGGIYVDGGVANLTGATISSCDATTGHGGGIYVYSGRLQTTGGTVTGNNSLSGSGGGIYVANGAEWNATSGTLTISENNAALNGGGVFLGTGVTGSRSGISISTNSADSFGGGIYAAAEYSYSSFTVSGNTAGGGGGIYSQGDSNPLTGFSVTYGSISNNTATSGSGGGVYVDGTAVGEFTIVQVDGNDAPNGSGGGVYGEGIIRITGNCVISGNTAQQGGGVCLAGYGANFIERYSEDVPIFRGNTATTYGGAMYIMAGSEAFIIDGCLVGQAGVGNGNSAQQGGGIYVANNGYLNLTSVTGSFSVTNNNATTVGGGVFLAENATVMGAAGVLNPYVSNNVAPYLDGVAQVIISADMPLYDISLAIADADYAPYVILSGTSATGSGVIQVSREAVITTASSATILRENSDVLNPLITVVSGGDLALVGNITVSGGLITAHAPLIQVDTGANLAVYDGVQMIRSRNVEYDGIGGKGGAVYVEGGVFDMYGGTIGGQETDYNTAESGGGVYVMGGTFRLAGGTIHYNVATGAGSPFGGGGVYINGSTSAASFVMPETSTAVIDLNNLPGTNGIGGAGIYFYGSNVTATLAGGRVGGADSSSGNSANGNNGGGMYINGSTVTLMGTVVSYNSATNGGGVYVLSGVCVLNASTPAASIRNNTATNSGGGLYSILWDGFTNDEPTRIRVISDNTADGNPATAQYYVP